MENPEESFDALRARMLSAHPAIACGPCPSVQEIQGAVAGTASKQAQQDIALHCAQCPACFEDWTVAQSLKEALDAESQSSISRQSMAAQQPARVPKKRRLTGWGIVAPAACACLVVFARSSKQERPSRSPLATQLRGRSTPLARSEIHAQFLDGRFSWDLSPSVESFELIVYDMKLQEIVKRSGLQAQSVTLDETMLKALGPTTRFYWQVVAKAKDGQVYRSSPQLEDLNVQRQ